MGHISFNLENYTVYIILRTQLSYIINQSFLIKVHGALFEAVKAMPNTLKVYIFREAMIPEI